MNKLGFGLSALALAAVMAHVTGCGCGVGPAAGPHTRNGAVTFDTVSVGASEALTVPFEDSVDTSETITGAIITGADAPDFEVVSTFPIAVPAGGQAPVIIRFSPTHAGTSTATLVLETQGMGPSSVELAGTGTAAP